jgi:hypothetical protein
MVLISEYLHRHLPLAMPDERAWMMKARDKGLIARVRRAVAEVIDDQAGVNRWDERQLFGYCKLAVLEKTKVWAGKVDERETEINLLAMNVIPTSALLAMWALKSVILAGSFGATSVLVPFAGLLLPFLLLRNIEPLRCLERQVVFEMFLELPTLGRIDGH